MVLMQHWKNVAINQQFHMNSALKIKDDKIQEYCIYVEGASQICNSEQHSLIKFIVFEFEYKLNEIIVVEFKMNIDNIVLLSFFN